MGQIRQGIIIMQLDGGGNSYVSRLTPFDRDQPKYWIESENTADIKIFCNGREVTPTVEVTGGQTILHMDLRASSLRERLRERVLESESTNWVGMNYKRENFAEKEDKHWKCIGNWRIPRRTLFFVILPPYSLVENINADGLERNKYKMGENLLMYQPPFSHHGGNLDINITYYQYVDEYNELDIPSVKKSVFPKLGGDDWTYKKLGDEKVALKTQELLIRSAKALDWPARGILIIKIFEELSGGI